MKLSIASLGGEPGSRYLEQVKLAERLGFHAFFHNDKKWARDLLSRLGAATQVTSRIGLGTSVIDPYTRHPALMAQATATLAELAPGRFRVVMGSGSHFETMPGYGNAKPVAALRESTQLMRALWAGEKITLDGQVIKFKDGGLDWKPASAPPLYIASRGPQILKLALPPGVGAGGRVWGDIRMCSWIYPSVLDREDEPVPDGIRRGVSF